MADIKYVVKYRTSRSIFWKRLLNVVGDGYVDQDKKIRFFYLDDNTRVEIPSSYVFVFSKERVLNIKSKMEQEAGQTIPLK